MWQSLSPRWRRLISSSAYGVLVALVAGLGYLTFQAVRERRQGAPASAEPSGEPATASLVDFDRFSAQQAHNADTDRLTVSLKLRFNAPGSLECYVYFMARNDQVSPKVWAVWPPQEAGGAVTAGGHFRASSPTTGQSVQLTSRWTRIAATIDHPPNHAPFTTVMVYVVSPKGEILLARPFAL